MSVGVNGCVLGLIFGCYRVTANVGYYTDNSKENMMQFVFSFARWCHGQPNHCECLKNVLVVICMLFFNF